MNGSRNESGWRISVVVATRVGWPAMRRSLAAILPQLHNDDELIVADSSGQPVPEIAAQNNVRWLSLPGLPSYDLRQSGYRHARAPIVAVTEDHCTVSPDWIKVTLELHERETGAAAIYGLVDNGTRDKAVDRALFVAGYLPWTPPRPSESGSPSHANLSFKRWAFETVPPIKDQVIEFRYITALRHAGLRVIATDQTRVTHFQSAGLWPTVKVFFHSGRLIGGLRRQQMSSADWIRACLPAYIATYRTLRTASLARTKPEFQAEAIASLPLVLVLYLAHALGEGVGYVGGPGQSGRHVH